MGEVLGVEPVFVVSDVARSVAHYAKLGFSTAHYDEGYAFASRNDLTIHLAGPGVDPERVGHGSVYLHVDDADELVAEWKRSGVEIVEWRRSLCVNSSSTERMRAAALESRLAARPRQRVRPPRASRSGCSMSRAGLYRGRDEPKRIRFPSGS